jgi:hypothetical protein
MTTISSLPSQQKGLLGDALWDAANFQPPIFRKESKLYEKCDEVNENLSNIERALRAVLRKEFSKDVELTGSEVIRPVGAGYDDVLKKMHEAVRARCDQFAANLYSSGFGRIVWTSEDSCSFDYAELHVSKGILKRKFTTLRHQHELVDARQHKLPATDVARPPIVGRIICQLPKILDKHLRIVTGLEVVKGSAIESEVTKPTPLGEFVFGTRDAVVDGAQRVAIGVANGAAAVGRALTSDQAKAVARTVGGAAAVVGTAVAGIALLPFAFVGVAIADPCLVLGDLVLVGWEN